MFTGTVLAVFTPLFDADEATQDVLNIAAYIVLGAGGLKLLILYNYVKVRIFCLNTKSWYQHEILRSDGHQR